MNILQTKTSNTLKQRGFQFLMGCFVIPIGLGILGYYGYCWGLWGRHSLLLQYLFQCNCPAASENVRYSKEVDIIIPACQNVNTSVKLLPSGRFLYLREE